MRSFLVCLMMLCLVGCDDQPRQRPDAKEEDFRVSVVNINGKPHKVIKERRGGLWETVGVYPE